jgi:hypothetical protein
LKTTAFLSGLAIHIVPRDDVPVRKTGADLRFGVGEVIGLTATAPPMSYASVAWSVQAGADASTLINSPAGGGVATFTAPDVGPDVSGEPPLSYTATLALKVKRTPTSAEETIATIEFDVIRPSTGSIKNHAERHRIKTHSARPQPNAGMWGMFMIGPADVSFQNVLLKEGRGVNVARATLGDVHPIPNTMASYHADYPNGHGFSADWMTPGSTEGGHPAYDPATGTRMGLWDKIQSLSPDDPAGGWDLAETDLTVVGKSDCAIDWHYTVRAPGGPANPTGTGRKFCTVEHNASVTKGGTLTVTKGGETVTKKWSDPSVPVTGVDAGW